MSENKLESITRADLDRIALKVANMREDINWVSYNVARAWWGAYKDDKTILENAWIEIIGKYGLDKIGEKK